MKEALEGLICWKLMSINFRDTGEAYYMGDFFHMIEMPLLEQRGWGLRKERA